MSKSQKRRKWLAWTDTSEKAHGSTINGGIMDEEGADAIRIATFLIPAGFSPDATRERIYGTLERASKCMNACDGIDPDSVPDLLAALEGLVKVNEEHNASVETVIGRPLNWKDTYLDAARAAIAKARGSAQ